LGDFEARRVSLDNVPEHSAAGLALARMLRLALPDEERCRRALRGALQSANRAELPTDGDELLGLVRAHLAPQLSGDVAPNLVFAMIDDLKAEIELQRAGKDPTSSSRLRAATHFPPPATPPAEETARPESGSFASSPGDTPFPKLRASVSNLRRATANALRSVPSGAAPVASAAAGPTSVVLVEPDRMMRASLARSLVGARFDVSVLETMSQVQEWLQGRAEAVIAVVDVAANGVESSLHALVGEHPALSVVAWTDEPQEAVTQVLLSAGVRQFRVVAKTASALDVVDGVRALRASGRPRT
jgi:hypothetical protein